MTEKECFLCDSREGRNRVPKQAIRQAFDTLRLVVTPGARCCNIHLNTDGTFTALALRAMVNRTCHDVDTEIASRVENLLRSEPSRTNLSFFDGLREHDYKTFFGLTSEQFSSVFKMISPARTSIPARN